MMKFTPALALAVVASVGVLHAQEITKPLGKWERKIGKNHITLIVEDNRLHMISAGESMATLHADYSITHDGVVYGVVTSIECDDDDNGDSTKEMFDAPFSFRFRIDEGALIIHDAKGRDTGKDEFYNGRFKAVQSAPSRAAVVPIPQALPSTTPPTVGGLGSSSSKSPVPPSPIGSSFVAPSGDQTNFFFSGYMR
jgi:hypothetical protein